MATVVGTGLSEAGIRAEFMAAMDEFRAEAVWEDLVTVIKSSTQVEKMRWLGSTPQMREWGAGRLVRPLFSESYDIESKRYEISVEIDRLEIEDDQIGGIRTRIREMAQRAAQHKDRLVGAALKAGGDATSLAFDGQPFFSATHETGKSGQQSNTLAPSATDANAPTLAEWKASFKSAIQKLMELKDSQGEPQFVGTGGGLVAVVPPSQWLVASEALSAALIGGGDTNILRGAARIVPLPDLAGTETTWFLLKVGGVALRPLVLLDRSPIEFKILDVGSEHTFKTERILAGVRARYAIHYGSWNLAVRSVFTV